VPSAAETTVTGVTFTSFTEESVVFIQTMGALPKVRVKQQKEPSRLTLDIERARLAPEQEKTEPATDPGSAVTQILAQLWRRNGKIGAAESTSLKCDRGNIVQLVIAKLRTSWRSKKAHAWQARVVPCCCGCSTCSGNRLLLPSSWKLLHQSLPLLRQ
jgi:hypothetical protein